MIHSSKSTLLSHNMCSYNISRRYDFSLMTFICNTTENVKKWLSLKIGDLDTLKRQEIVFLHFFANWSELYFNTKIWKAPLNYLLEEAKNLKIIPNGAFSLS